MYFLYYLRDMMQLILSPSKGWEDIALDNYDAKKLLKSGLIPLILISSIGVWINVFLDVESSVWVAFQQMTVCFIKYLATFYLANFVFTLYLPICIDGELSLQNCQTFICYGVGLLAFINLIQNIVPVEIALLYILPVYVLYILWRGLHYMNIGFHGVGTFILMIFFAILMPAYLIQYLFNLIS